MAFTPNVVDGNIILAAWGNEIRDRTCQVFATAAERDSQWVAPPDGALCVTRDTWTLWRRMSGTWQNRNPFTLAAAANPSTDGFGNFAVILPAGGKWLGATCNSASTTYPALIVVNATDGPVNGPNIFFNVRHPDGSPWASVVVSVTYLIAYTF